MSSSHAPNLKSFLNYISSLSFHSLNHNQSFSNYTSQLTRDILETLRGRLLLGWKYVENEQNKGATMTKGASALNLESIGSKKREFIKRLAKRMLLSEERAFHIYLQYLSINFTDGSTIPTLDDVFLSKIINFYHSERVEIINMSATVFRRAKFLDVEPSDETQEAFQETAKWLLSQNFEQKCVDLLRDVVDVQQVVQQYTDHVKELGSATKLSADEENFIPILIQQKLKEQAAVLELLYVIYYTGHMCQKSTFLTLFTEIFIPSDFGHQYLHTLSPLTMSARLYARRITCAIILITIRVLRIGEIDANREASQSSGDFSSPLTESTFKTYNALFEKHISGPEDYAAAMRLVWGSYIYLNSAPSFKVQPKQRHWVQHYMTESLMVQRNALKFFISMLDESNVSAFPFKGRADNFSAYQADIESMVWCTLKIAPIERMEFLIADVVRLLTLALKKNAALQQKFFSEFVDAEHKSNTQSGIGRHDASSSHHDHDNTNRTMITDPYVKLYRFIRSLYPLKSYLVQFLSMMVHDERSARFAFDKINSVGYFSFRVAQNEIQSTQPTGDELYSVVTLKADGGNYQEALSHIQIPRRDIHLIQFNQLSDAQNSVVTFKWNVSGWNPLLCQFYTFIQLMASNQNLQEHITHMQYSLELIYKLLSTDNKEKISIELEKCVKNISHLHGAVRLTASHINSRALFSLLISVMNAAVGLRGESPSVLLAMALRCLIFYARKEPFFTAEQLLPLCSDVLTTIIYVECDRGEYDSIIALLEIVDVLAENHPPPVANLLDIIQFVCSSVFSVHETWRYRRLSQRWIIAQRCLKIFNTVSSDAFWRKRSRGTFSSNLVFTFFTNSSLYYILFTIIGFGSLNFQQLTADEKLDDALLVEEMITEALQLLKCLLEIRLSQYNAAEETSPTPFEQNLMSQLIGPQDTPLIATIFDYIDHAYSSEVAILSCTIINLIAKLTEQYHPRPPSLIGYLNRTSSQADTMVNKCMTRLSQDVTRPELRRALFELIATAIELQRGLADKFLLPTAAPKESDSTQDAYDYKTNGCMKLVIRQLRQYVDEKKNRDSTSNAYPLSTTNSKVVLSCCRVIQNVFVGGKYEQIVKSLRTDSEFWTLLYDLCECGLTTVVAESEDGAVVEVERIQEDVNLMHAIGITVSIFAVNLYNTSQLSSTDEMQAKKDSLEAFLDGHVEHNEIFIRLLRKSLRYTFSVANDTQMISSLESACKEYRERTNSHFQLSDYVIEYRAEGDPVYDIRRMRRWEKPEAAIITEACSKLNLRLSLSEACVSVMRSVRRIVSVFSMNNLEDYPDWTLPDIVNACFIGLRVVPSQSQSRPPKQRYDTVKFSHLYLLMPVPVVMKKVVAMMHMKVSQILLSSMKGLEKIKEHNTDFVPLTDNQISQCAEVLDLHLSIQNWEVCKNVLASLLYTFTRNTDTAQVKRTWLLVAPVLIQCAQFGVVPAECSELALSILSLYPGTSFTSQNIQFLCKQLNDCLLHFADKNTHTFTNSLLHLLLNVASTRRGCSALLNNFLIEKLTNATFFHSNELYDGSGRRSSWHIIWCLVIQLLIQMYITSYSHDIDPNHPSKLLSSMSQEILEKICDFCVAHSERILSVLLTTFSQTNNISFASLIEIDIISKLIFELARSDKLYANQTLVDACLVCMTQGHSLADRMGFFLKIVQPISDEETKLFSQEKDGTKAQPELDAIHRERLSWTTRLHLCLFGTMRNILASIRCMTQLPLGSTIEMTESSLTVLNEYALRMHVIPFMRTCTDALTRLSQQPAQSSSTEREAVPGAPTSAKKQLNQRSATAVSEVIVSALQEALFVVVFHSVLFRTTDGISTNTDSELTPLEKELLSMIEAVKKEFSHLQQTSVFHDNFKEITKVLDAAQQSLSTKGSTALR